MDKTGFISELIRTRGSVNLFTRPRRFGKSLMDKAYQKGYYSEMVQLIRLVFSRLLKTNANMYFAVITGCLRIAKESIFTGLNNFKVRTISDVRFAEYFGFTNEEVKAMLSYYGLGDKYNLFKEWYDGYHFGNVDVYCPWSVINQCDKFCESRNAPIESHWANSSNNVIIKDIIEEATESTRADIEALISGQSIKKKLVPELTYTDFDSRDVDIRQSYLWSVLFATGYITDAEEPENGVHTLMIPNKAWYLRYKDPVMA